MVHSSNQDHSHVIHQYYMDIINCIPEIVYWIDVDCMLKGCNHSFIQLLGLQRLSDCAGTPYEQMSKHLTWSAARIESFKLDDMAVLFSNEPHYDKEEPPVYNADGTVIYYRSRRIPLLNQDKQVVGLVVVLEDITDYKKMQNLQNPSSELFEQDALYVTDSKKLRVLLVEDNIVAQSVEQALFEDLNCEVDIANSGMTAAALFEPGKYQIVFMDIGLQDTSGYVVSKKIREMEQNTEFEVPIIALTSYQADIVKYDCDAYFMSGVITKPLTKNQANSIIQRYVHHANVDVSGLKSVK